MTFYDTMSCSVADMYQCFGGTYCFYLPVSFSVMRMGAVCSPETSIPTSRPTRLIFKKTVVLIFTAMRALNLMLNYVHWTDRKG
jgi:hypothetical protein